MFVNHRFVTEDQPLEPPTGLYEYLVGANGVFIHAQNPLLRATFPISRSCEPIRGLAEIQTAIAVNVPKVPVQAVAKIFDLARQASPNEILFWLLPPDSSRTSWQLVAPEQIATGASVRPVDPYHPKASLAFIEVHSHHSMPAFFSQQDDRDETGFRIYAVLGHLDTTPTIAVRVGVYGHFWDIPATTILNLPLEVQDGNYPVTGGKFYDQNPYGVR